MVDPRTDADLAVYLRATRIFATLAERSAEAVGLTLAQMRVLLTLSDLGAASCSAVAARLHVSASSVTRLIARPAMATLISRRVSPANASAVELGLTEAGRSTVREVLADRERILRAALDAAGPETAAATAAGLQHIIDSLEAVITS